MTHSDEMYSGFMPIALDENDEGSFFFWLAKSRSNSTTKKLVVWLNGGPGCSSMVGMMNENGLVRYSLFNNLKE